MDLYTNVSFAISKMVTNRYSTSFSMATALFDKKTRDAIYSIYGFVRVADEIVDTFHEYDKVFLLENFISQYKEDSLIGLSTNPILHSFIKTIQEYSIEEELIDAFLKSMKFDLTKKDYEKEEDIEEYIYGSAEVVGLMCLRIFANNNNELYERLKTPARKLGSAFQKVNFLRDLHADSELLGRQYFPEFISNNYTEDQKRKVVKVVEMEFVDSLKGIKELPKRDLLAVYSAYLYYLALLQKIERTPIDKLKKERVRISNTHKILLLFKAVFIHKLGLV